MLNSKSQKLCDILFNLNVRSSTREAVLLGCLKRLNVDDEIFLKVLTLESQNPENVLQDRRSRERSDQELGSLQEREMRLMRGDGLPSSI